MYASYSIVHQRSQALTGCPGFDAGNFGIADLGVDPHRFNHLFQQVPDLNAAILFPDEENSWPGKGPASHSAPLLGVW